MVHLDTEDTQKIRETGLTEILRRLVRMWKKVNKGTGEAVETEETGETREAGVFGGESLHKGD